MVERDAYAERALRAHAAMEARFRRADGLYRRDGRPHRPGAAAHLWPFARALVATLDVIGAGDGRSEGGAVETALDLSLRALERYDDPAGAYASDPPGLGRRDVYYDDNAWVGLALLQLERMRPGSGWLPRVEQLYSFAAGGWDGRGDAPSPGGVFWLLQGRGLGRRNHDRNTVSTAPSAAVGLHLRELGAGCHGAPGVNPELMYEWVNSALDSGAGEHAPGAGPFWDKIRGDGSIDRTLWSYNQGSMVAVNVLLARGGEGAARALHLARAEAIAARALRRWSGRWESQPPAFNAILFRNLLMLHQITGDRALRSLIVSELRGLADLAWERWRGRGDLFSPPGAAAVTLLHQSAAVQLLALAAWEPERYELIA